MLKFLNKYKMVLVLLVALIFGVLLDIATIILEDALIYVDENYLSSVFGAVCTVAVLGNAILSIIIGASEQKIMGISFQSVLRKTLFGRNMFYSITVTLITIILAALAYAHEWYTTITFFLASLVTTIVLTSVEIWRTLSNVDVQRELVFEIIGRSSASECHSYIVSWFQNLRTAISLKNQNDIEQYVNLLDQLSSKASSDKNSVENCIASELPETFRAACESYGFVYGYELIARINRLRIDSYLEEEPVVLEYIHSTKYRAADEIAIRNMNLTVDNIIKSDSIPHDIKWGVIFGLIHCLNDNVSLTLDDKRERIGSIFKCLCSLRDGEYEEIKVDVLLSLFREEILLKDDRNKREWLHLLLVEHLMIHNLYNQDKCFIKTISEMFRALFFYVHYETETLTESYRNDLRELYSISVTRRDVTPISFASLIEHNREDVVTWLAEDAVTFEWRRSIKWDYYPKVHPSKSIVWDRESVLRFAYCYFKVIGSARNGHPFMTVLKSQNLSNDDREGLCKLITSLYSSNGLSEEAIAVMEQIAQFIGCSELYDHHDNREQKYFQDELVKLIGDKNIQASKRGLCSNDELITKLCNNMKKSRGLHINQSISCVPYTRQRLRPNLVEISPNYMDMSAYRITHVALKIINAVISRKLSQIEVGFDADGVNTLLRQVEAGNYQYRNYAYINDLALKEEVISSEDFHKLSEALKKIPEDKQSDITSYVFLMVPQIDCRIDVDYHLGDPTDLQCEEFIRTHEIADEYYQINGYKLDYVHAIRFVRENFKVEYIDLKIHVAVDENTGFKLNFRRRKTG